MTNTASLPIGLDESRLRFRVISLAWPVIAEETFTTLVGLASAMMVGHLGAAALAGVGLATQALWFPEVTIVGVSVGATAVIARRIGAGRRREAGEALHQSILIAAVIALVFVPALWFLADEVMILMQAKDDVIALGTVYLRAGTPGLVPALIMFAGNAAMRGAGDTRTPMLIMIAANVTNIAVGYVLIYGLPGLPALGVLGAGVASSIAWSLGCFLVMIALSRGSGRLHYQFKRALTFDLKTASRILNVGFPAGMEQLQFQLAFTLYSVIISALGTTVFAAHTVALRVENIAFMPGFGLGVAATTLVGQALGAGRPDLAERAAKIAQWYAIALMSAAGVLMGLCRHQLVAVFVDDPAVIDIGALGIVIYALSLPMMGTSNCLAGSLRGAGDTRTVMFVMTAGAWLIRLPFAYALAYWAGFGAAGAWTAAVLDINMRGLLLWWRFGAGRWKAIRV